MVVVGLGFRSAGRRELCGGRWVQSCGRGRPALVPCLGGQQGTKSQGVCILSTAAEYLIPKATQNMAANKLLAVFWRSTACHRWLNTVYIALPRGRLGVVPARCDISALKSFISLVQVRHLREG